MAKGKGIDYGMGTTNIDAETGIRYGVIPAPDLSHWALDDFEPDYGDPTCPKCGGDAVEYGEMHPNPNEEDDDWEIEGKDYCCQQCKYAFHSDEAFGDEPNGHVLDDGEYLAILDTWSDVFVMKSPYYTNAQFCSPCAGGAVHLSLPVEDGERGYCFGHEMFEKGTAPYPVYCVKTAQRVLPANPQSDNEGGNERDAPGD